MLNSILILSQKLLHYRPRLFYYLAYFNNGYFSSFPYLAYRAKPGNSSEPYVSSTDVIGKKFLDMRSTCILKSIDLLEIMALREEVMFYKLECFEAETKMVVEGGAMNVQTFHMVPED